MRTVQTLIEDCLALCGSQHALAVKLGSTQQDVHKWLTGKRPVSPVTVGQLCDLIHLDGDEARRLAAEAVIATAKPEKQGVLRRAFFVLGSGALCGELLNESTGGQQTKARLAAAAAIEMAKMLHCASAGHATGSALSRVNLEGSATL